MISWRKSPEEHLTYVLVVDEMDVGEVWQMYKEDLGRWKIWTYDPSPTSEYIPCRMNTKHYDDSTYYDRQAAEAALLRVLDIELEVEDMLELYLP